MNRDLKVPALTHALELDGMESGCSLVDIREPWHRPIDVAYSQIHASLTKKWEPDGRPSKAACDAARERFLRSNLKCASWRYDPPSERLAVLLGETREAVRIFWEGLTGTKPICTDWSQILAKARTGPGAAVGAVGVDFYTKLFSSPLTSPSTVIASRYHDYAWSDPAWAGAERARISQRGHGCIIRGSRLSYAPKNADVARCICVEPNLGMYFQLGFGKILELAMLRKWGLDLRTQQFKNRELARRGSCSGTFATIDLSCASDSISYNMLKWLLPKDFHYWISKMRSPDVQIGSERVELHMVSSMGNGFTFPLQTMIFACIIRAVARCYEFPLQNPWGDTLGNWAVFGDDIIVPVEIYRSVLEVLTHMGFEANSSKTFVEGPFRESCGSDWYLGHQVRGVYLRRLNTPQSRVSAINRLNQFSAETGLAVRHLVQLIKGEESFPLVPPWENDDAGIRVPSSIYRGRVWKRFQSASYKCFVPQPKFLHLYEDRIHVPPGYKRRDWNPDGLFIALLQGSVNTMKIGLRKEDVIYRTERRVAPCWDALPVGHALDRAGFDWRRFECAVETNLIN